jgi:hypothetical protein
MEMSDVLASSPASSLPPLIFNGHSIHVHRLLAKAVPQWMKMSDVLASSRAGSLPQEKHGLTQNQVGYQAASRWTLISAPR